MLTIMISFIGFSCGGDAQNILPDELPFPQPFERVINLSLPTNQKIQFENHLYFNDIGLNGVVVVRLGSDQYAAYERTCPVDLDSACAIVEYVPVAAGSSFLRCQCGEAVYRDFSGEPSKSPEPRKLREYATFLSGDFLTVESRIVN